MQKLLFLFFTAFLPTVAFSLPIGNPWGASLLHEGIIFDGNCTDPSNPCAYWCDAWSLRFGFYGDYVFDRHFRVDEGGNHSTIHRTEIYTNAAYLAYNVFDRIDIFGTLGATSIGLSTPRRTFETTNTFNDYLLLETETDFSWSIGVRGTIWESRCFGVGAEIQYFSTRPKLNFLRDENNSPQYGATGQRIIFHEWQIGLGAAYRYYIISCSTALVPYIGLKWSRAWLDSGHVLYEDPIGGDLRVLDLKNDRYVGYAVGITLVGCDKVSVTVEGRFVDERALHVNAQFRF